MDYRPIGDRVIIKKDPEEDTTTTSGLLLVSNERNDKTKTGVVVAVGPGKFVDGHRIPMELSVGDKVVYNGMYGTDIGGFHTSHNNEYMILHEQDVIGVLTG